jgi:hypothetical protein
MENRKTTQYGQSSSNIEISKEIYTKRKQRKGSIE